MPVMTMMNRRVTWTLKLLVRVLSICQMATLRRGFDYKLAWFDRLEARAVKLLESEIPVVLGGDYNVIPDDLDCHDPASWTGDALTARKAVLPFVNISWV